LWKASICIKDIASNEYLLILFCYVMCIWPFIGTFFITSLLIIHTNYTKFHMHQLQFMATLDNIP
jgi:hypothetical protein